MSIFKATSANKVSAFLKFKMANGCPLEKSKNHNTSKSLTNFDEIWYDVYWPSEPKCPEKKSNFRNPRWRTPCSLLNALNRNGEIGNKTANII